MNERDPNCSLCNHDQHICQGCGEPVPHELGRICERCRAEHGLEVPQR